MDKTKKSVRKHHEERIRAKAKARVVRNLSDHPEFVTPRRIGMTAATPTPCSCAMCGNYRKNFGIPFSELLFAIEYQEGIRELV